ncbi:MAG: DUF615 domain-containing protein [Proteobacteria bacterium]|nr:DUF615 domain-containing protein [Pseudomonadota bacterium]MDE3207241.1 DUF615 domain-containing protein [Pseudomonadota bacterium]
MPEEKISKTQLKKTMLSLQDTGKSLAELSTSRLNQLQLPDTLREAIIAVRHMSHEARRRQLQYIGKLMRQIDVTPIREKLTAWAGDNQEEAARFHMMERWRDKLIHDDAATQDFIQLYPSTNIQQLRNLIRNSRQETQKEAPPKNSRLLFRYIREILTLSDTERKQHD